jgi:hypothetical protein
LGISVAALPALQLIQKQNNAVASQRTIRELGSTGFGQLLRSEKSEGVTATFAENIGGISARHSEQNYELIHN